MTGHIRKRETKKGSVWQIIIDRGIDNTGKRLRDYITVQGTKKEAQRVLNEKISEYGRGQYSEPTRITVRQHMEAWIASYAKPNLSPTTVAGYLVNINRHIVPAIGDIAIQKLAPIQIQQLIDSLVAKGFAPRTVKYVYSTLREGLQYAYKLQLIPRNPADLATLPRQTKSKGKSYDEEEAIKLLQAAKDTDMEAPLTIALGLGLRRGELLALKWCDIDFKDSKISITRNLVCVGGEYIFRQPKSEAGVRVIEMPAGLTALLRKHKVHQAEDKLFFGSEYKDDDLVCCKRDGTPYNTGSFSHRFNDFLKKHGLREIRLHDLRHTNASLMLKYNIPAKVASQRLGHSTVGITLDLYSHVIGDMQTEAAGKIDDGIFKKLG